MFDIPTEYCEQLLQIGWEPINTISNIAFIFAGIFAFYKIRNEKSVLKFILPILLMLVGVGSSWWHISHTHYGDIADTFFILIFASVISILFFKKLLQSWTTVLLSFFGLLGITLFTEQLDYLNGSLPYIVLFTALIIGGIFYGKKFTDSKSLLITTIMTFGLAIIFRSIDIIVCPSISFGTHFLWHILVAILGYQLILLVVLGKSKECQFDVSLTSHIFILPGMLGIVSRIFPLVRYLRKNQSKYGVTVIPLGLSLASFENIVRLAEININKNLLSKIDVKEIIIFGHSHGGRVACALFEKLSHKYPKIIFSVITAGTPIEKPENLSWYRNFFYYLFSCAFRKWPKINQPTTNSVKKYIGYYSDADEVVASKSAKQNHTGILLELKYFSHRDFIKPDKIGSILLPILRE